MAIFNREMQWSSLTKGKQKNHHAQKEFRFIKNNNNNNNNNKGRQLLFVLRLYISVALQQKTANFKAAIANRVMQWSFLTEEKQKNELTQKEFRFIKNNNNNKGRQLLVVLRLDISVALQQKTANFKMAPESRLMQWSAITEAKQNNELAA